MRSISTKLLTPLLAITALGVVAPAPAQAADAAYFVMTDITSEEFVVKLTDPAKIQHARDLVNGQTTERPHVIGRFLKRQVDYNPRWSYHLNTDTVDFFDVAIEVCDATIPYLEDHLDEAGGAFLPGSYWCDWSSRLVREVAA
ncbi:calmodulin-binding protein [Nonomuraea sp. NPDC051191]|uniref:BP74-related protein n=1 Tax=Nonomuraea sp. NPDC051191 TaxID=3364372 RepID=UPI00379DB625